MPQDPQEGNAPQIPATMNSSTYPPVETPGEPLVAFGNKPDKGTLGWGNYPPKHVKPRNMRAFPARTLPGRSVRPRPRFVGP